MLNTANILDTNNIDLDELDERKLRQLAAWMLPRFNTATEKNKALKQKIKEMEDSAEPILPERKKRKTKSKKLVGTFQFVMMRLLPLGYI
jgi:gamma-glutamyl phosphate reductase